MDSTAEFGDHPKVVTDKGLRKDSAKLAVKDDRAPLRPSQYIFVGNVSAKITALQEELELENELYEQARARSAELDRERTAKEQRRDAYRRVCEQFAGWNEIDLDTADDRVDALTDADLLAATTIAAALGFSGTVEAQDEPVSPRGHRLLGSIPRLRAAQVEALVGTFGTLQTLLAASAADLQAVPGIGSDGARQAREGLSRLAEASVERF